MRCKACNGMMAVQWNRGRMEDLCARCRTYVYYDLASRYDSQSSGPDLTQFENLSDTWDDPALDRNKENLGFLDEID